jgi:hypothetical protein
MQHVLQFVIGNALCLRDDEDAFFGWIGYDVNYVENDVASWFVVSCEQILIGWKCLGMMRMLSLGWIEHNVIMQMNIAWVVANVGSCGMWQQGELMKHAGWLVLKCSMKLGWCSWKLWVVVGSLLYNPDWYCCRWFAVQHAGCIVISICAAVASIWQTGGGIVVTLFYVIQVYCPNCHCVDISFALWLTCVSCSLMCRSAVCADEASCWWCSCRCVCGAICWRWWT